MVEAIRYYTSSTYKMVGDTLNSPSATVCPDGKRLANASQNGPTSTWDASKSMMELEQK